MKVHIMSFLFTQFGSIDYSEQEIDRCIGILKVELQMKVREDVTIMEPCFQILDTVKTLHSK